MDPTQANRRKAWLESSGEARIRMAELIGVPRTFCRGETFLPTMSDPGIVEQRRQRAFPQKPHGILILGAIGTHKTHLLCARAVAAAFAGRDAMIVNWNDLLLNVRATFAADAFETEKQVIETYAAYDYLGVDDFGIGRADEQTTDFAMRVAYELFNTRYERGNACRTDITANLTPQELDARFDGRVMRRIREITQVYVMDARIPVGNAPQPPGETEPRQKENTTQAWEQIKESEQKSIARLQKIPPEELDQITERALKNANPIIKTAIESGSQDPFQSPILRALVLNELNHKAHRSHLTAP